jgi:hypothetical protein
MTHPSDFPLKSTESRVAARRLAEQRRAAQWRDSSRYIRLTIDDSSEAREFVGKLCEAGDSRDSSAVRLLDTETGREIPIDEFLRGA